MIRTCACALVLLASAMVGGESSVVGNYRLSGGPDSFGELSLRSDGRFAYALGAGALDEHAAGRWIASGTGVRLYTEPRPKPAVFSLGSQAAANGPLKVLVTWPNGAGIAGIDLKIGFDAGPPVTDYTQDYGWTISDNEHRVPRWVELAEPIHGVVSPRFMIDAAAGNVMTFVLTPNDLGVADFDGTSVERLDDHLVMHQRLGDLTFVRSGPAEIPAKP